MSVVAVERDSSTLPGHAAIHRLVKTLAVVEDPRGLQGRLHAFSDILVILVLAVLCRCDDADAVEEWANKEKAWLRKFIPLRNGIPSQDTYLRALSCMDPKIFREAFREWVRSVFPRIGVRGQIAMDGKTLRGAKKSHQDSSRVHLVSALDCEMGIVLAQLKTDEKSNEITTMPELLSMLSLRGSLVSIDAMGAQVEITKVIVEGGGDYLIGLKENQPSFRHETEALFQELSSERRRTADETALPKVERDEQTDGAHGRIEIRRATVCHDFKTFVPSALRFHNVRTLIEIDAERTHKTSGKITREKRYYFSSREMSAREANWAVRGHWAIESAPQAHGKEGSDEELTYCAQAA